MDSSKNTLRKIASLTLFLSGIVLVINSVVICLRPPNYVAHFCGWLTINRAYQMQLARSSQTLCSPLTSPDQSVRSIGEENNLTTGAVLENMRY